jgi:hypothetical protein
MMAGLCPICSQRTEETACPACGAIVDPQLELDDKAIDDADNSPGGQCYEGRCCQDDCLESRTAHFERGVA